MFSPWLKGRGCWGLHCQAYHQSWSSLTSLTLITGGITRLWLYNTSHMTHAEGRQSNMPMFLPTVQLSLTSDRTIMLWLSSVALLINEKWLLFHQWQWVGGSGLVYVGPVAFYTEARLWIFVSTSWLLSYFSCINHSVMCWSETRLMGVWNVMLR